MTDGAAIAAPQLESTLIFKAPLSQRKWLIERRFTRSKRNPDEFVKSRQARCRAWPQCRSYSHRWEEKEEPVSLFQTATQAAAPS